MEGMEDELMLSVATCDLESRNQRVEVVDDGVRAALNISGKIFTLLLRFWTTHYCWMVE